MAVFGIRVIFNRFLVCIYFYSLIFVLSAWISSAYNHTVFCLCLVPCSVQIFACRVKFHQLTYRYADFLSLCGRSVNTNHLSAALICEFRPCAISLLAASTNSSSLHSSFMLSYFCSRERPIQPLHTRPGASFSPLWEVYVWFKGMCVSPFFPFLQGYTLETK